jgi:hypothetical protein
MGRQVPAVQIERGDAIERTIFEASATKLSATELHRRLDSTLAAYIRAACVWDEDAALGDHRFVVFSTNLAADVPVALQFWSEPFGRVLCEVSSGMWNPTSDSWIANDRAERVRVFGFERGGEAQHFQQEFVVETPAHVRQLARLVVEILARAFDYRGETPLATKMAFEGRSELRDTYDAFSPEEVMRVFSVLGYDVDEAMSEEDDQPLDPPMLRCRKYGIESIVLLDERVPGEDLYRRARFSGQLEMPAGDLDKYPRPAGVPNDGRVPFMTVSNVHSFGGGVTFEWLIERVREWDLALAEHRRDARRGRKRKSRRTPKAETVH